MLIKLFVYIIIAIGSFFILKKSYKEWKKSDVEDIFDNIEQINKSFDKVKNINEKEVKKRKDKIKNVEKLKN